MPVVLATLIFILMVLIPFLIALKELFRPKDDTPLYIDMQYAKDPLYFGKAFKKLVQNKIAVNDSKLGTTRIKLSKVEPVEICDSRSIPGNSQTEKIFYVKQDFSTGTRTLLRKDVYVKGVSQIGKHNVLRAIYGEHNIYLGKNCRVIRWVSSEEDIYISGESRLGRSVSCTGQLLLGPGSCFHQLFGSPIVTAAPSPGTPPEPDPELSGIIERDYPEKAPLKRRTAWKIIKDHVSINCEYGEKEMEGVDEKGEELTWKCCNFEPGMEPCKEDFWTVSKHRVTVKPFNIINTNFVSRKELLIKENCKIHCAVKAYKDIIIEKGVEIHGDIFSEGDIYIGEGSTLLGHVFSQSGVFIGNGVRISQPGTVKSVIGKRKVEIGKHAVIYGYILSEGGGIVKW
ncbi:MAG: hypothetical protein GY940_31545 [bacterium]|nr:hypothetical protein [bacterium]